MTDAERGRAEELYQQHLEFIKTASLSLARRYGLNFEDTVQDAGYYFLEVFSKSPTEAPSKTLIATVLRSRVIDAYRKKTGVRPGRKKAPRDVPVSQFDAEGRERRVVDGAEAPTDPPWTFNDDARLVVDLLCSSRIRDLLRLQRKVYQWLRDGAGWGPVRFERAWNEVVACMPESARPQLQCEN